MGPRLPGGTVTFLFTDIEGSTRLLHELGDAYADVLAEHHRLLESAFGRRGGVVFGMEGDALFVAFARASDALDAAAEGQAALAGTGVRVRMGMHTGEPVVTGQGYVGKDVHRVARIAAAAHGGQVLLSEEAARLVDTPLRDLGRHRLKDFPAPTRIFQLGDATFPPLRTAMQRALPSARTPLVGRNREIAEVGELVCRSGAAVVTLVGPGGVGKTRLALAVAGAVEREFTEGAVWVGLGGTNDPALAVPTIAQAIGNEADSTASRGDLSLLVVLDDVDGVVAAAGEIARFLDDAPRMRVLATSRQPLRLSGERQYPVDPLPLVEAEELFRTRAAAVRPEVRADEAAAEICRRLDGLPLAIELAAARVNVLSPAEIARRLDRRLALLTAGPADAPLRQRTLRSTIEWSYDLLSEPEQTAFARLAVFTSWSLDAAEEVAGVEFETLAALVEKSLVQERCGRFAMLETVREYARDLLAERGESREVARRHAEYFVELAEASERTLILDTTSAASERVRAEHDNIRVALAWALEAGETEPGLRLASALVFYWFHRDYLAEGERWLSTLLAAEGVVSDAVRARALSAAATLAGVRGDGDRAIPLSEEGVALARRGGDAATLGRALLAQAHGLSERGEDAAARDAVEEALPLLREPGNDFAENRALQLLAGLAQRAGDFDRARELLGNALAQWRERGAEFGIATTLHSLGDVELDAGRLAEAQAAYADGLRAARRQEARRVMCYCLAGLAAAAAADADHRRAATLWNAVQLLEDRLGFRLRDDRGRRYAAYVADVAADRARSFAEDSLLEDAAAYALGETAAPSGS